MSGGSAPLTDWYFRISVPLPVIRPLIASLGVSLYWSVHQ